MPKIEKEIHLKLFRLELLVAEQKREVSKVPPDEMGSSAKQMIHQS